MRFDVAALLREPVGSIQTHKLEETPGSFDEEGRTGSVTGSVSLLRTSQGILVTARLQVTVNAWCSRCVKPIAVPLAVDFQEEYLPTVDADTGSRLDVADNEDGLVIDGRQVLDLSEAVRQYRLAVQPIQMLCQDDCKGLCPNCGKDLNLGLCSCDSKETEHPMYALAHIRDSLPDTNSEEGSE